MTRTRPAGVSTAKEAHSAWRRSRMPRALQWWQGRSRTRVAPTSNASPQSPARASMPSTASRTMVSLPSGVITGPRRARAGGPASACPCGRSGCATAARGRWAAGRRRRCRARSRGRGRTGRRGRSDATRTGSVRRLTPPAWIRSVAWPTIVTRRPSTRARGPGAGDADVVGPVRAVGVELPAQQVADAVAGGAVGVEELRCRRNGPRRARNSSGCRWWPPGWRGRPRRRGLRGRGGCGVSWPRR